MFKFNFSNSEDLNTEKDCNVENTESTCKENVVLCKFINVNDCLDLEIPEEILRTVKCGNLNINYLTQKSIQNEIEECGVVSNIESDLIPGKYEGGFKVWECSIDLSNYIAHESCINSGSSVLELGCGVGLPGIVAYLLGADVTFQDFNSEVLEMLTIPNVFLNSKNKNREEINRRCNFLCGDWESIREKFYNFSGDNESKKFDIILTSETIYDKSNYKKLLELMKSALKPKGTIYLASKVFYFGVGGGLQDFLETVKQDNILQAITVAKISNGLDREIIKLYFKETF